ncbi:hypothetical protein ACFLX9_04110 [Chloroflexota bacterium]
MKLIVVGARGAGIKIVQAVTDSHDSGRPVHEIVGFIDDSVELKGTEFYGYPVLGTSLELDEIEERVGPLNKIGLVCVIGDPTIRQNVINRVSHRFKLFPNVMHPSAQVSKYAQVGKGNLFCQNVVIQAGATVGDFNVFNVGAVIGTFAAVTDYCTLKTNAVVACLSKLEPYTALGAGCVITANVVVGSHCTVGPNSYVTRNLEDGSTVLGVPAKKIS